MIFRTTLQQGREKNVVGIRVPPEVVEALGAGKRPPVRVTLNGYSYASTIAVMGGDFMIGVAAEHREKAGVKGGETLDVEIVLDAAPRVVEVPADLRQALDAAGASAAFDKLAFTYRKEHARAVNEAKAAETRARRIQKIVDGLSGR